jgi:hypothetical protein
MHTINSPTSNISRFLDRFIRPIFNEKVATTGIIDGAHLIKRLRTYANDGHLKPTTYFVLYFRYQQFIYNVTPTTIA